MTSGGNTQPLTFRTPIPARYRWVLGVLGALAVAGTVAAAREAGPAALLTGVFTAVLFAAVLMMTARIQVGGQGLRIRVAGVFTTEILYREMTAVSAGPVTGLRYGMGLRILPEGTGYLVGGPSVRIGCRNSEVLVSCQEPERLIAAVAPRLPGTGRAGAGQSGELH